MKNRVEPIARGRARLETTKSKSKSQHESHHNTQQLEHYPEKWLIPRKTVTMRLGHVHHPPNTYHWILKMYCRFIYRSSTLLHPSKFKYYLFALFLSHSLFLSFLCKWKKKQHNRSIPKRNKAKFVYPSHNRLLETDSVVVVLFPYFQTVRKILRFNINLSTLFHISHTDTKPCSLHYRLNCVETNKYWRTTHSRCVSSKAER